MLGTRLLGTARVVRNGTFCSRNFGLAAPALQKASDPIQQLFIDKIREYKQKSVGGKLVDPSPAITKELAAELDKLAKAYGGSNTADMTQFPTFKFQDPVIDPINMQTK